VEPESFGGRASTGTMVALGSTTWADWDGVEGGSGGRGGEAPRRPAGRGASGPPAEATLATRAVPQIYGPVASKTKDPTI
jgi:hypothetical protein